MDLPPVGDHAVVPNEISVAGFGGAGFTLDTYTHGTTQMQEDIARKTDGSWWRRRDKLIFLAIEAEI